MLGDIFDEGNWVNDQGYDDYVSRFRSIFEVPPATRLYAIHGNHDINFHYAMHPYLINRFNKAFNASGVRLIREKKIDSKGLKQIVNFVSINSMAMEGDGCSLCNEAEFSLKQIEKKLNQLKTKGVYSQPIVLQHFPLFRESDEICLDTDSINKDKYRERHDTLSKVATEFIEKVLDPRAYFSGHSHHHCRLKNSKGVEEFTLASFNWRNTNNPSFLLAVFKPNDYSTSKCEMPKESTVIACYVAGVVLTIILVCFNFSFKKLFTRSTRTSLAKDE